MGQNGKRLNTLPQDEDFEDEFNDQLQHPQQRNAANARERARMRVLSKAFCRLKTTLPWVPPDTKLSKLDTLRLATSYIAHLRTVLKLSENEIPKHSVQPSNMSWPFNFNVNWDTHILKADTTSPKTEWKNFETKMHDNMQRLPPIINDFAKTADDYQHERRFSSHRTTKIRQKTIDNDEDMNAAAMRDTSNNEFNYYKPYSYYQT